MALPIFVVDAFAERAFSGNPAAVVLLTEPVQADWMQSVAEEMKHAETAFVRPLDDGYELRWFTPSVEVDLCGHATLATAHVLVSQGQDGPFRFHTRSGVLSCWVEDGQIAMDFPSEAAWEFEVPAGLEAILGSPVVWFGRNRMDWFAQLADESAVRSLAPSMGAIKALGLRGIVVTAASVEFDFMSRFFAPQAGVPEDSVTGSAHCALAPFWASRLGRYEMRGFQASPRGGIVGVKVVGDRVELRGSAVTVLSGSLLA